MFMSISVLPQKGSEEKKKQKQLGGQNINEASTTQWT